MVKIITHKDEIIKLRKESKRQIERTLKSWRKHKSRKTKFNFLTKNHITGYSLTKGRRSQNGLNTYTLNKYQ